MLPSKVTFTVEIAAYNRHLYFGFDQLRLCFTCGSDFFGILRTFVGVFVMMKDVDKVFKNTGLKGLYSVIRKDTLGY